MDATTIEKIEKLVLEAAKANRLETQIPAILCDGNIFSLEQYEAGRSRFRGAFKTNALSEFSSYVKAHEGGHGFIDAEAFRATVIHNLGDVRDPGHADWTSTLQLKPTAAYAAILAIDGKAQGQKQLVEWIEDWAAELTCTFGADGVTMGIASGLAAIRNLTISAKSDVTHTDKDFGASRSALEQIEAKASGGIPTHLSFSCVPYIGFRDREFDLRLSVITGDKPMLTLRIVSKEATQENIALEFKSRLLEEIGGAATMTIGTFTA